MKTDKFWNIFLNVNEMIRSSDTKAGVLITVYGVLITIVYSNSIDVYNAIGSSKLMLFMTVLVITLSVLSILFCFLTLNPRLKNTNHSSLVYFGHINDKYNNYLDYYNDLDRISETEEFEKHVSEQIYHNSSIAAKKFFFVNWAIRLFIFVLFTLLINLLIYLL